MIDDFTPTVEQVKDAYSRVGWADEPEIQGEKAWQAYYRREAEFDRWIASRETELQVARGKLAAINARLDVMLHPYSDERIPKVKERDSIRELYGEDIVDDLEAILSRAD